MASFLIVRVFFSSDCGSKVIISGFSNLSYLKQHSGLFSFFTTFWILTDKTITRTTHNYRPRITKDLNLPVMRQMSSEMSLKVTVFRLNTWMCAYRSVHKALFITVGDQLPSDSRSPHTHVRNVIDSVTFEEVKCKSLMQSCEPVGATPKTKLEVIKKLSGLFTKRRLTRRSRLRLLCLKFSKAGCGDNVTFASTGCAVNNPRKKKCRLTGLTGPSKPGAVKRFIPQKQRSGKR